MQDQPKKTIDLKGLSEIKNVLDSTLNPSGFECYPFKIGLYNEHVSQPFTLMYHPDTLAFVIISTPSMFEKAFIPFLSETDCLRSEKDPLDQCMLHNFSTIKDQFPMFGITTIHDFELTPHKRPKVLVQTAGHVSRAVHFYQRQDLKTDPWEAKKKIFGVCLHPKYGGWFALRGVVIFTDAICPDLPPQTPREILSSEDEIVDLLRRYNDHWEDGSFRDIIPVEERYSEQQIEYFSTKPADRDRIINGYLDADKNRTVE